MNAQKHEGRLNIRQKLFLGAFFHITCCDTFVNIRELIFEVLQLQKAITFFRRLWVWITSSEIIIFRPNLVFSQSTSALRSSTSMTYGST